jgi:uncharacterized protein (TIGR03437 family)
MRPIFHSLASPAFMTVLLAGGAVLAQAQAQTPQILANGVVNAASGNTPVAVGSLISIYGSNLSPVSDTDTAIPLPPTMDGVRVTVNGVTAPLWFVSAGQINAQIPWEALASAPPTTNTSTAQIVVTTTAGGASASASVSVAPAAPGIFTFYYGSGQAIAYNYSDSTFAAATPIAGYQVPVRPAKINDPNPLIIYATGLGPVSPTVADGAPPPTGTIAYTVNTPTVLVGGMALPPANVLFSGLSSDPGVYQLNVTLPTGTPTGNTVSLQIQMNGFTSRSDVTIAVSQ